MASLYEIQHSMEMIAELYEANEIDDVTFKDMLESSQMDAKDKIENICKLIANKTAEAKMFEEESNNLHNKAQHCINTVSRLKEYIMKYMAFTDKKKLDAGLFKLSIRKASQAPLILDCDIKNLPDIYKRVTVEENRTAIRDALKAGTLEDGIAHFGIPSEYLMIK